MRVIPSNTATAALRRIPFTLVDATDLVTPEDIVVTGVKVSLSIDGGTPANSTNDIVKVAGATGEYYLELTQAESNQAAGALVRGSLAPSGCALTKLAAQVGPAEVFSTEVNVNAASVRTAVGLASANLDTQLAAVQADTDNIQTRLPAALVGGRMDASVGAMAANVMTAAAAAADLTTELQAGLATAAALSTVAGYIDTEIATLQASVDRVEVDTQDLQARVPAALVGGRMDASVGAMAANVMTAAAAAPDLTTELQAGLATAAALATVQADTDNIQTRLPAALVGGRMDASVGAMAANVMTAAAAAADLTTELQSGLATAAALTVVDNEIAALQASANAIEADTQDLQARVPAALVGGRMDVSVGAMAANVMTAAAAAPDLTTELQAGLATQALLATVAGYIDTEIAAIANAIAAQNNLSAAQVRAELTVELGRIDAAVSTRATPADVPTAVANADALLGRSIAGGANGGRTVTSALRRLRNRVRSAAGVLSVYREDDTTVDHTATVTTAAGDPITEVDPV